MNATLRSRLIAVVSAGTLVGLLGGTGIAFADHAAAPRSGSHPSVTCQSFPPGEQAEGRWFGHALQAAR